MTFASAERAYLAPPEPHECPWCERDYDECRCAKGDAQAKEDAEIERADARRKGDEYA